MLPKLPRDAGDRNRTSPFAFTGNKFEFRAVSSGQNIAFPNMVLNVAMAESLDSIATELEKATSKGEDLKVAVGKLLTKMIKEHKRIIFNGNNYSRRVGEGSRQARPPEPEEHRRRAAGAHRAKDAIKLLEKFKILNEREVHARYEVFLENYNKTINVEGQLMVLMANRYILPAAFEYQKQIGQSVAAVKAAGGASVQGKKLLATYTKLVDQFKAQTDGWRRCSTTAAARPRSTRSTCATRSSRRWPSCARSATRSKCSRRTRPWPLPTYREMLFVK